MQGGLAALSLRPLAQRAGVSVAVIVARFGAKAGLLEQITGTAAAQDQAFFAKWRALADLPGDRTPEIRAALAELAFQDWVGKGCRRASLLIELVHDRALRPDPFPALEAWLADSGRFWAGLIFGTEALADLAQGYILDEAGFALAAADNPAYQLLRALCLRRFAAGILPPVPGPAGPGAVERLIEHLRPLPDAPAAGDETKRRHIAASAGQLIVSQGIGAVTHRSVALAARVPPSTVVYHFGAQPALVIAGLHAIVERFRKSVSASGGGDDGTPDVRNLVKATSLIALAAAREPGLVPAALDMRRRRGENITATGAARLGLEPAGAFDRTAAQVLSVALFGMQMVAMARQLPEQTASRASLARLAVWRATLAG